MEPRTPRSTRPVTLFPYTHPSRSQTRAGRADLSLAGDTPDGAVSCVALTDPDAYGNVSYFEYGTQQDGREPSFRVDASYELDAGPIKTLEAGFRWAHHRALDRKSTRLNSSH